MLFFISWRSRGAHERVEEVEDRTANIYSETVCLELALAVDERDASGVRASVRGVSIVRGDIWRGPGASTVRLSAFLVCVRG